MIKVYNMLFGNQQQLKILLYDNLFHPSYIFSTCNQWEQWSCHQQVDQPRVQTSRNPQLYGYTSNTWNVNIYNPVLNGSDELLWRASDIDVQSKVHECPWEHRKKTYSKLIPEGSSKLYCNHQVSTCHYPQLIFISRCFCSRYYQGSTDDSKPFIFYPDDSKHTAFIAMVEQIFTWELGEQDPGSA